jgi:hypothetical protein
VTATETDQAVVLLERLLSLSERTPDRVRPASLAPNYDELRTADSMSRFEARLLAAQKVDAIAIEKGKRERRHLIDRVRVKDVTALARHLGRTPASEIAQELNADLAPIAAGGEAWVGEVLQTMMAKWSRGEPAYRLAPSDRAAAQEFMTLLAAISKDAARGLDGRTFSHKTTGDTKSFDRQAGRIGAIIAARFDEPGLELDAVWSRIGLERFRHPVHVRGDVVAEDESGILVDGRATPFASFHPELTRYLKLRKQPSLLLTIENYASFNRYAREIVDGSLVVYTGGFASAGVVDVLRTLLTLLPLGVPFYHWGDIDPGGIRIFRFLEETLPRPPRPHLMDRSLAESHGKRGECDLALKSIATSDSAVAGVAEWLWKGENIRHLEQEALDPTSPLNSGQSRA